MLHKEAGCWFSYIRTNSEEMTRQILALSPHKFQVGTTLFYNCVLAFDSSKPIGLTILLFYNCVLAFHSSKPIGLTILVQISLSHISLEYLDYAYALVSRDGNW